MKHTVLIPLLCLFALFACEKKSSQHLEVGVDLANVQVHFSPGGSPTTAVINVLDEAKRSVHVQAYSFTSALIASALKSAHDRGVKVLVVLDKSQRSERYTSATFLTNAGIPVWIDKKHAIAHNKVMIIDESIVITGSFNFTKAAEERNAENLLIISNKQIADEYLANWEIHRGHSEAY
ncbi:MAG: phospholipase D family protein [Holophagaceae bacterium]|nr:phospholipase D family protein [Holophagaceae bacterium]